MSDGLTEYTITGRMAIDFLCESPVGHAVIDKDGSFLWLNQSYCDVLNARREQVLGTTWMKWTHSDDLSLDAELAKQVAEGTIRQYRMVKKYKQLGHTNITPRIIAGSLIVFGNFDDAGNFLNYRVTFDSYVPEFNTHTIDYEKWLTALAGFLGTHWKTVLAVLLSMGGLTLSNYEKLFQILRDVPQLKKDLEESASGSSGFVSPLAPGPSVPSTGPQQ